MFSTRVSIHQLRNALSSWLFPGGSWGSFYTTVLATFLGALLGIPAGLYVQQLGGKATERALLQHIHCELEGIQRTQLLTATQSWDNPGPPPIYRTAQIEFWEAISSGGGLQNLSDPALAFILASTYSDIRAVNEFLAMYNEQLLAESLIPGEFRKFMNVIQQTSQLSLDRIKEARTALTERGIEGCPPTS